MEETCKLIDFMAMVAPWLDGDYIREAYINPQNQVVLQFLDGAKNYYMIDDCTEGQLKNVLSDLKNKGIPVRGYEPATE